MATPTVPSGVVAGKSGITLMARVLGHDGEPVTRATLGALTYTLTDTLDGTALGTGTLTISSVVFDDLRQNDPRWTADSAGRLGQDGRHGYNFRATLPASIQTSANRVQCDLKFTPVTGEVFFAVFQWTPQRVYGS